MPDYDSEIARAIERARRRRARLQRNIAILTLTVPALATLIAVALAVAGIVRPQPVDLVAMGLLYCITMLGITIGFHRLYTHHSFTCGAAVRFALGVAGSMAAQGPMLFWVSAHRRHHQFADRPDDPHTPLVEGQRTWRGFWHAHIQWMCESDDDVWVTHVPDLLRDPVAVLVSRWYALWVLLGLILPGLVCGLWYRSAAHAIVAILWGGFVRMFLVHHATWSVNSICHMFGSRRFDLPDHSRNNIWIAILTFGEGWHHNHHAYPYCARHGLEPLQIDISYAVIALLCRAGLAANAKTVRKDRSFSSQGNRHGHG
jgi:stearoyl-CoA desaturase (delta-9 desaturase)